MSTSPYSLDLRKKVIEFIEAGNSQVSAAKIFNLNISTVNTWYLRYKTEGHYLPKKRPGAKPKVEHSKFVQYIEDHPNATTAEMGEHFGMTYGGAHYWLRKLGFSYKKKPLPTWKLTKKSGKSI